MVARLCTCESSPPGFVARDGIHCGYCHGHFPTTSCPKHEWAATDPLPEGGILVPIIDLATGKTQFVGIRTGEDPES